ncbi:MAG TPA: DedA family protein [Clostridiaceae bacterium]|nr:DedA family protein [Clostridiaceae bacterium]
MKEIILEIINQFGYIGIMLLIAIENIFPPIPSEVILTFGGFLTTITSLNVWGVIIFATLGSVLGAIVLYTISRILNTERLERLFDSKLGKILRLKKEDVRKAEKWFNKHGNKAVFLCRFVPIVRSLISVPAGIARMDLSVFLFLTVVGTFIWNMVLVFLGRFAKDAWETIITYVDLYKMVAIVVFALIALVAAALFIKNRFFEKKQNDN